MSIVSELQKIGLSDKEAKVYLATLELAQETVQQISEKSKVNRATTYFILESLHKKGLVSTYEQDKKTYYIATSPDALESLFEIQKKEIDERQKNYSKLLPQLRLIHNKEEGKPVIRFYEGKESLLKCNHEFLRDAEGGGEEILTVTSKDLIENLLSKTELGKHVEERLQHKLKVRTLYNSIKAGDMAETPGSSRRKVSHEQYPITMDMAIYGDSVRIASLGEKVTAVLIKDKEIANTLVSLFELGWAATEEKK